MELYLFSKKFKPYRKYHCLSSDTIFKLSQTWIIHSKNQKIVMKMQQVVIPYTFSTTWRWHILWRDSTGSWIDSHNMYKFCSLCWFARTYSNSYTLKFELICFALCSIKILLHNGVSPLHLQCKILQVEMNKYNCQYTTL